MALKFPQKVKNLLDLKDAYSTFLFDLDGVYVIFFQQKRRTFKNTLNNAKIS